jgi:hypothetical protein
VRAIEYSRQRCAVDPSPGNGRRSTRVPAKACRSLFWVSQPLLHLSPRAWAVPLPPVGQRAVSAPIDGHQIEARERRLEHRSPRNKDASRNAKCRSGPGLAALQPVGAAAETARRRRRLPERRTSRQYVSRTGGARGNALVALHSVFAAAEAAGRWQGGLPVFREASPGTGSRLRLLDASAIFWKHSRRTISLSRRGLSPYPPNQSKRPTTMHTERWWQLGHGCVG